MDQFNPLDLGAALVLVISGAVAFFRGAVREILTVGVWIGAAFATLYGFSPLQPLIRHYVSPQLLADSVTALVIFIIAMIVLTIISNALSRRVQSSNLGALDRSLGFMFGLARGGILAAAAYLMLIFIIPPPDQPTWLTGAKTAPLLRSTGDMLLRLLPEETARRSRDALGTSLDQAKDAADRAKALERAITPLAPAPGTQGADPKENSGYKNDERRALEGLIRSSRDKSP